MYNATPQEGLKISPFKVNYGYKPRTLLSPRQAKKSSEIAKERVETLIDLHKNLQESAVLVQESQPPTWNDKQYAQIPKI